MENRMDKTPARRPPWAALLACALLFLAGCETVPQRFVPGGRLEPAGFFDTVVVDAGHGGHDPGARAPFGKSEKHLALDTARRLAGILRASGFRVIETRTADYFVPLDRRVRVSNRLRNAVFVSIHYNWARRTRASGVETFYYGPRSSRLAANIQSKALGAYATKNRGIKYRGFYVLRNNRRPAVLCELGFVSNAAENARLQNPAVRQRIAQAVAAGIIAERNGLRP
jgi:N-acetylmuramoyl-L-alanine amidase